MARGPLRGAPASAAPSTAGFFSPVAGVGVDHARLEIDLPDAVVADIADQQVAGRVEGDACGAA